MTTKVPDIMLQKPASTVASMTNSARRRSIRRPRTVLRMMMNGAANTRNGTAAQAFFRTVWAAGFTQPSNAPGVYSLPVVFTLSAP